MIGKLAVRNLLRNRRRSLLTAGGAAAGTALLVFSIAMFDGMNSEVIRGATGVQLGQIQIEDARYVDKPTIYNHFPEDAELFSQIEALPEVEALVPRCLVWGLIGHEERSEVAQVVGTDPVRERQTTLVADAVVDGSWLLPDPAPYPAPREMVLGDGLADYLQVSVGDELALLFQAADGSLGNDLLKIVGIVHTGNQLIDRQTVYMNLADVQYDAVLEGQVHEVAIRIRRYDRAPAVAASIDSLVSDSAAEAGRDLVVRPWQEIVPEIVTMVQFTDWSNYLTLLVVYGIVALALLNAMRMSALERRREFGVMLAIGLTPRRLFRIIEAETVVLTLLGALAGALLGGLISAWFAHFGFNMAIFSEEGSFEIAGVAFSGRLYFELTPRAIWIPLVAISAVAVLCGLWPAVKAARLNVTRAIAGRS